jgi:hypothetical protein
MTVRAALVLGLLLIAAAFVRGGLWAPGHDFIVNRFTGEYQFVPADDYEDEASPAPARHRTRRLDLTAEQGLGSRGSRLSRIDVRR